MQGAASVQQNKLQPIKFVQHATPSSFCGSDVMKKFNDSTIEEKIGEKSPISQKIATFSAWRFFLPKKLRFLGKIGPRKFWKKSAIFEEKSRHDGNIGSATEGDFLVVKNDFLGFIFSFWSC